MIVDIVENDAHILPRNGEKGKLKIKNWGSAP